MSDTPFDILVLTDLHYTAAARHACAETRRQTHLARVLARKAMRRLQQDGIAPALIVLLGDLVDNGEAPDAAQDLVELAGEFKRTGLPVLTVPGNHDGGPALVSRIFQCQPGLHEIGGYGFIINHDQRLDGERFFRPADGLALPAQFAAADPNRPLIALQHHALHPAIVSPSYPYYMLENGDDVLESYRAAGVLLSLSGHYHAGQPMHLHHGTYYQTVPALSEAPFRFTHVRLQGRSVEARDIQLRCDTPGLVDVHNHSEFAYCASSITAGHGVSLARTLGLTGLCVVEHTFQLYFPREYAWSFQWQHEPERVAQAWRDPLRGRMAAYRTFAQGVRAPNVCIGLEVELYGDGLLLLAPQDASGWDLLLGAIHEIDGFNRSSTTQSEAETLFMRDIDSLLTHPIQVLAHPFRFFARKGLNKPADLYAAVADRLAAAGVAAEINFHSNEPEPAFFEACLKRGVRLALGSDAHDVVEAGDMAPHLRFMQSIGMDPRDYPRCLFRPSCL